MDLPPETDAHLAGAIKKILWRLMAVGHNRAELLMVEMHEERVRAQMVIFAGGAMAIFAALAILTVTALIACAFASHLLLTLGVLAAFYCIGAVFFYVMLSRMLRQWETFTGTREQFERDRECLEKKLI
ncbi:MAG TPA: phage holin family protein [Verrucomicrobiae bacterium]|jgi:uncharacterized membrane protein YqjE